MIVRALACLRAVQFALWIWVPFVDGGPGRFPPQVFVGYVVAAAFSTALFVVALRRDTLSPRWVVADVLLAVCYATLVSRAYAPVEAASISNWVIPPLCGVTVTAAIYAGRYRLPAVLLVVGAWVWGAWPAHATAGSDELLSNSVMMALFAGVAGLTGRLLFRAAGEADFAAGQAVAAESREAAVAERMRHMRQMHDTVLQTLEGVAQGMYGGDLDETRRICGAEAEHLRSTTVTLRPDGEVSAVVKALAEMIRNHPAQQALRRVNTNYDPELSDLPFDVVEAVTGATREALTNVVKYAHAEEVRVTVVGLGPHGVKVTVLDHGAGFDTESEPLGFGTKRSIVERMEAVHGKAVIDSLPGEGTTVEVSWTP